MVAKIASKKRFFNGPRAFYFFCENLMFASHHPSPPKKMHSESNIPLMCQQASYFFNCTLGVCFPFTHTHSFFFMARFTPSSSVTSFLLSPNSSKCKAADVSEGR